MTETINPIENLPTVPEKIEKPAETVPLNSFLEQKKASKDLKERLAVYEDRDKKEAENKLIEEKKFQDVIQAKEKEVLEYKTKFESTERNYKIKDLQNKFARGLDKNNAINSDDILKLVDITDLIDSETADVQIASRVEDLVKNKSYLFSAKGSSRSETENGQPTSTAPIVAPSKNARANPAMELLGKILNT